MESKPWKQAIPTNLLEYTNGDKFAATVFCLLLLRARNSPGVHYVNGTPISLETGQCVVGRYELSEWLGLKQTQAGRVQRVLSKLKSIHRIDKRKSVNCSIITIQNFEEIVNFRQQNKLSTNHQQTNDRQSIDTNKQYKSGKNDKSDNTSGVVFQKIEKILGDKFCIQDGKPYYYHQGTLVLIGNPVAFAKSLPDSSEQLRINPILTDPQFQQYLAIYRQNDDLSVRKKMQLETFLNNRYPDYQYAEQWREAEKTLRDFR